MRAKLASKRQVKVDKTQELLGRNYKSKADVLSGVWALIKKRMQPKRDET
jgi:hypothetical protein